MAGLRSPETEQYWSNTPQNPVLGAAAAGLRKLKDAGGVVGEFFLGEAPEEIEKWSYGNSPFRERVPGVSPRYPELKSDRRMPVVDAAMLPVGETIAAAKLAGAGLRGAYNTAQRGFKAATDGAANMGRREALKKIGAGAGYTAAGAAGLRGAAKLMDEVATPANVARAARRFAPPKFTPVNFLDGDDTQWVQRMYDKGIKYWSDVYGMGDDAYEQALGSAITDPDYFGTFPGNIPKDVRDEMMSGWIPDGGYDDPDLWQKIPAARKYDDDIPL